MQRIEDFYRSQGYYSASVTYTIEKKRKGRVVDVVITIKEGQPVKICGLHFSFSRSLTQEEGTVQLVIEQLTQIPLGSVFVYSAYDEAKTAIETYLINNGYPSARVTGKILVNTVDLTAGVTFCIALEERRYFGSVTVDGNTTIKEQHILDELAFKQGDVFSRERVYQSQRAIFNLGLFESVTLSPEENQQGREVPVTIHVTEREKRSVETGVGYGLEDQFRAEASWRKRYFLGRPATLSWGVRYSSLLWSTDVSYVQQPFIDQKSNLGLRSEYDREYLSSYNNEKIVSQVSIGRTINATVSGSLGYNLEVNRPTGVSATTIAELQATRPGDFYFISSLIAAGKISTVDNEANPTRGSMLGLYMESSSFLLGSKLDYLKGVADYRIYVSVLDQMVTAGRVRFGFVQPGRMIADVPIFKRFFSGGSSSVRGYGFQSLGPKDNEGKPLGGDWLVEGNSELRVRILKNVGGVLFIDAGNVYQRRSDIDLSNLFYSVGAGIRYATVVGPFRFDIAFPLEPFSFVDFSRYQIYFSLGNAF
jgi:outer membrane protein assembly complex protein YaeT